MKEVIKIGGSLFDIGSTIFATRILMGVKFHLTGEIIGPNQFHIDRIWRDSDLDGWDLPWYVNWSNRDKVCRTLILGEAIPASPFHVLPSMGSVELVITNPKKISDYNDETDKLLEISISENSDAMLASLFTEWKEHVAVTEAPDSGEKEIAESSDTLEKTEKEMAGIRASSPMGTVHKVEIVKHWIHEGADVSTLLELIDSIQEDLESF